MISSRRVSGSAGKKRRSTGAVQDLAEARSGLAPARASWSAGLLHRFLARAMERVRPYGAVLHLMPWNPGMPLSQARISTRIKELRVISVA
jgi:hypothetical protein